MNDKKKKQIIQYAVNLDKRKYTLPVVEIDESSDSSSNSSRSSSVSGNSSEIKYDKKSSEPKKILLKQMT